MAVRNDGSPIPGEVDRTFDTPCLTPLGRFGQVWPRVCTARFLLFSLRGVVSDESFASDKQGVGGIAW